MSIKKLRIKLSEIKGFDQDNVLSIMVLIRSSLESANQKDQYEHLNLYCNWCVHSRLSERPIVCIMLKLVTDCMNSNPSTDKTILWYTDNIANIFDSKKLRLQLVSFLKSNNLPTILFDSFKMWQYFFKHLREIISEKPICFPKNPNSNGKIKLLYDHVENIAKTSNGNAAKEIFVTTTNDTQGWHAFINIVIYKLGVTIQCPFMMNEFDWDVKK